MSNLLVVSPVNLRTAFTGRKHFLIKHFSSRHNVFLFNVGQRWKENAEGHVEGESESFLADIHIIDAFNSKTNDIYVNELFSLTRNIQKLSWMIKHFKIDVVVNFSNITLGAATPLWSNGTPVIFDFLDYRPLQVGFKSQSKLGVQSVARRLAKKLTDLSLKNAGVVVSVSDWLREYTRTLGVENAFLIPNGFDSTVMRPIKVGDFRRRFGFSEKDVVLGYLGGVHVQLDLELVMKALTKMIGVNLLVVGSGTHLQYYIQLADKMGLNRRVKFTGRVARNEVLYYYNVMDVGLLPFKRNLVTHAMCPLKLFEYLACGKPVVSSSLDEVKKLGFNNYILYADSPDVFVEKIALARRDVKVDNGEMTKLLRPYDWKVLAEKYCSLIENMVN